MNPLSRLILKNSEVMHLRDSCSIGRSVGNTLTIPDDHVSRYHAIIQLQGDDECWLVDLGSSNGTLVNGRRVSRPQLLNHRDVIGLGDHQLIFETDAVRSDLASAEDAGTTAGSTIRFKQVRPLWLMVADIADSTRMVREIPPEEVARISGGWFKDCRELIEKQDGHMNQYLGDGFLCYWEDNLDIRERILNTMRSLALMQARKAPVFRFVLHYGKTLLSGVPTLSALTLHGESVHFVFRMEKLAGKWGDAILCSEQALAQLRVPSLARRESEAAGFSGLFPFFVPDLEPKDRK
jgi:pSer/pThr/pTyr-binding forkhead associated (FHA) protein